MQWDSLFTRKEIEISPQRHINMVVFQQVEIALRLMLQLSEATVLRQLLRLLVVIAHQQLLQLLVATAHQRLLQLSVEDRKINITLLMQKETCLNSIRTRVLICQVYCPELAKSKLVLMQCVCQFMRKEIEISQLQHFKLVVCRQEEIMPRRVLQFGNLLLQYQVLLVPTQMERDKESIGEEQTSHLNSLSKITLKNNPLVPQQWLTILIHQQ